VEGLEDEAHSWRRSWASARSESRSIR
jgi:hypothetical protein